VEFPWNLFLTLLSFLDQVNRMVCFELKLHGTLDTLLAYQHQSTDTFLSIYNDSRYCVNCNKKYDRADEVRLREQKMDEAQWAV